MTIQEIKEQFESYEAMYKGGYITKDEYQELLSGLEQQVEINEDADDLQTKQDVQTAINVAIMGLSAL